MNRRHHWQRFFPPVLGLTLAAGLWWQLSRTAKEPAAVEQNSTPAQITAPEPDKKDIVTKTKPPPREFPKASIEAFDKALEELLKSDPLAHRADMTLRLYVNWNKNAGFARGAKVGAVHHFQSKKEQCVAYSRLLKLEEMADMLRDPDYGPMLRSALQSNQERNAQGWGYHEFGFQPYVPPEMMEAFLNDPAFVIEQLRPSARADELDEDFRDWYRDAIRADLYFGVSEAYFRPKIKELRQRFLEVQK